jgi:DNA-binding NarL/FixJ family response regulator
LNLEWSWVAAGNSMTTARIRTMVVDDSPTTLSAICEYLRELPSIEVVATATDGREALEKFEQLEPALVLMDFQMPRVNGLQAMTQIKASRSSTKVIIFTVYDSPTLRGALLFNGADGFLSKSRFYSVFPAEMERLFPALNTSTAPDCA